jgi:hypothetical protein
LVLWFTYVNHVLYAHDWEDHDTSIAIAVCNIKARDGRHGEYSRIILKHGSNGERLVREALHENKQNPDLYLNKKYKLFSDIPFRLLK